VKGATETGEDVLRRAIQLTSVKLCCLYPGTKPRGTKLSSTWSLRSNWRCSRS